MTTRSSINSIMGISMALIGLTLASTSSALAAATAPGPGPSPSPSPSAASSANSGQSEQSDGQNLPLYHFVSPDGHVVVAYDAIRSPRLCADRFADRQGNSDRQQSRFWTRCILGYTIR